MKSAITGISLRVYEERFITYANDNIIQSSNFRYLNNVVKHSYLTGLNSTF